LQDATPQTMPDAECYRLMADMPVPRPAPGNDPIGDSMWHMLTNFAGMLRRDGLRYVRAKLAAGAPNPLQPLLEMTAMAGFRRTEQVNGVITTPEGDSPGLEIDCRAGCSACCHLPVVATIPEAILVAQAVALSGDAERVAIILETAEAFAGLGNGPRIQTGRPCAMLSAEKTCTVYAARPIACRSFMAADAKRCHTALANALSGTGDDSMEWHIVPQFVGRAHKAGIRGICKDLGLQDDSVDLVQGVAAILRDPPMIERWAAGERVFTGFIADAPSAEMGAA
jgi:Fe-S-cluster containining protein